MAVTKVGRFQLGGIVYYTACTDAWALFLAKVRADIRTVSNKFRGEHQKFVAQASGR